MSSMSGPFAPTSLPTLPLQHAAATPHSQHFCIAGLVFPSSLFRFDSNGRRPVSVPTPDNDVKHSQPPTANVSTLWKKLPACSACLPSRPKVQIQTPFERMDLLDSQAPINALYGRRTRPSQQSTASDRLPYRT